MIEIIDHNMEVDVSRRYKALVMEERSVIICPFVRFYQTQKL